MQFRLAHIKEIVKQILSSSQSPSHDSLNTCQRIYSQTSKSSANNNSVSREFEPHQRPPLFP